MTRLSANLWWLFTEVPYLDRFEAAARAGFQGVELQFPYDYPPEVIADRLKSSGLTPTLLCSPPGNFKAGELGWASHPGAEARFQESIELALSYAEALHCSRIHVMPGIPPSGFEREELEEVFIRNFRWAADRTKENNVEFLIEPANRPGLRLIVTSADGIEIVRRIDRPRVKLLIDYYHAQSDAGNLTEITRSVQEFCGYFQIGSVPARSEPDQGEVNFEYVLELLDQLGYDGWIGLEYRPRTTTLEGLGWARRYGIKA